ncbi:MAG: glycoside hydrolase family 2 TIM barrel-domain containing protein [Gemmatimonadaceae bacterium]
MNGRAAWMAVLVGMTLLPACRMAQGQGGRAQTPFNDGWRYREGGLNLAEKPAMPDSDWQAVSLPHTWNAADPFDDVPSYRRGVSWYRKHFALPEAYRDKLIHVRFEGVNQVADVFMNGAFIGRHMGGYTSFTMDVTRALKPGENVIAVQVDNSHDPFIPPLSVGYALYGGIYRDVWLIATDSVHVTMTDHGSSGVYVTTPMLSAASGEVSVRGSALNETSSVRQLGIVNRVMDASGRTVSTVTTNIQARPGATFDWNQRLPAIGKPRLWSPDDPYLYRVVTEIREAGRVRDRVENPLGFRWFAFDAERGFTLNGRKLQLKGTNRHQDYQGLGSALRDSLHVRDMMWIKNMGANFVRLAHYPQDPAILAAADTLGLLLWEEIPVVNYITPSVGFTNNSATMLVEMIRQHFNHPSVITWGIMNEVYLWSPDGFRIRKQTDTAYMSKVLVFSRHLDSAARAEDPTRVVSMAVHGSDDYDSSRVSAVTAILGQNIYSGWYGGVFADFGKQLDRRHATHPREVIFVSEYGAEDDHRVNSLEPSRFDFSGTWMRRYHESYIRQINARPWLGGTAVWNQFDFSQPETGGSIPYMNQKGLQQWDRTPKDAYYLYKANWNPTPMVYIASRGWSRRTGVAFVPQPVDVYSNHAKVELFLNGRSLGVKTPDDVHRATWDVTFAAGANRIVARAAGQSGSADSTRVDFAARAAHLSDTSLPFREIGVNAGGKAQYAQPGGIVWEGDQTYEPGAFGHVDGEARMFDKDLPIKASRDTPLFFTYLSGLSSYRLDVPDGDYEIELLLSEPEALPGERVFSAAANGVEIFRDLDLAASHGIARATSFRAKAAASGNTGLDVRFSASRGKSILNAIRVRRI